MKFFKTIFIVFILSLTLSDAHTYQNQRGYRHSRRQSKPRRKFDHLMTRLHHAAIRGELGKIERLLESKHYRKKINEKNNQGQTPLHLAALKGNLQIVRLLIDHEADVNAQSDNKKTPLHFASFKGNLQIVKLLIHHGANVNAQSDNKKTPLHFASFKGNFPIMKHLIAHGADVNAQKDDGETALHITVSRKQRNIFDVIEYLFLNNADVSLTCSMNKKTIMKNLTILHVALICKQSFEIIQLLIKQAQQQLSKEKFNEFINAKINGKNTALHMAVSQKLKLNEKIITCILQHGADITLTSEMSSIKGKEKKNLTPLHVALLRNQPFEVIKSLIEHAKKSLSKEAFNKFINAQKSDGETALYIALAQRQKNIFEVVKYLLQNNADISQRISITAAKKEYLEMQNTTALHIALINKQPFEIIQLLIEHAQENFSQEKFNKFINAQIGRGDTALHIVSTQGRKKVIKYLIACGADLTLVCLLSESNNYNITLLHLALLSNQTLEIIKQFVENAKKLLSKEKFNAFINAQTSCGQTALDIALTNNKEEAIEYLLKNGAAMTLTHTMPATKEHPTEKKKVTSLHAVLLSNQPFEIIQLLVEHAKQHLSKKEFKTFINAQTNHGQTALHIAVTQDQKEAIKYLLENGANPNIQDNDKTDKKSKIRSPFQLLIRLHEQSVIKYENQDATRHTSKDICELIRHFLEYSARIDLVNKYNQTPLYWLICHELINELKVLIENSTQKNNLYEALKVEQTGKTDEFGKTIWDTIEIFYNPEIIDILLNTKNKEGKTLIDIARERNNQEILMKLESYQLALEAYTVLKKEMVLNSPHEYPDKDWFFATIDGILYSLSLNYAEEKKQKIEIKNTLTIKKRDRQEEIAEKTYQLYKHKKLELRFDSDAQTLEYRNKKTNEFQPIHNEQFKNKTMFILKHPDKRKFYYWHQNDRLKFRQSGTQQAYNLKLKS